MKNKMNSENISILNSFVARACGEKDVKIIKDGFGHFCTVNRQHGRIDYNPWKRVDEAANVMLKLKIGVEPMFDEGNVSWRAWVITDNKKHSAPSMTEAVCRAAILTMREELYEEAHNILNRVGELLKEAEIKHLESINEQK